MLDKNGLLILESFRRKSGIWHPFLPGKKKNILAETEFRWMLYAEIDGQYLIYAFN